MRARALRFVRVFLTRLGSLGRSFDFRFRGMRLVFAHGRAYPPSMPPQTRYVRSGDVSIAYQAFGEGPFDVVLMLPWGTHVELAWEAPSFRALFERLGAFARVINFDKRGSGLSDRSGGLASPETRMDDIRAVMDAVGLGARRDLRLVGGGSSQPAVRGYLPRPGLGVDRLRRACRTETGSRRGGERRCVRSPKDASRVSAIRWELS